MDEGVRQRIHDYLLHKGLRRTVPREAIIEAAFSTTEHYTAEELLLMARKIDPNVSRATIYRTLPLLVECGVLKELVTPVPAPPIDQNVLTFDGVEEEVRIATTRPQRGVNALGLPALAMPCGASPDGRPYGLQIIGPPFAEARLLEVGAAVEDRTEFHRRHPAI